MKRIHGKISITVLLAAFLISSCKQEHKTEGYRIRGHIEGLKSGLVYLKPLDIKGKTDSVEVKEGKFDFEGIVEEPLLYELKLKGRDQGLNFVLSNENIEISAKKDSLFKAKINGASENKVYRDFYDNVFSMISKKAGPLYMLSDSLTENGKVEMTPGQQQMMNGKWTALSEFADSVQSKYILDHKDRVAGAMIIQDRYITYPNFDLAGKLYDSLSPEVQRSFFGKKVRSALEKFRLTAVGNPAPDFSQPDLDGNMVSLSDYKGKYVFLDFWASWCAPCRKENPNVLAAYHKYKDRGLKVIGVSLDDKKELWVKAIEEDGLPWLHLSDLTGFKNEAAQKYGVNAIPQNFLIDPDGVILAKNLREEALEVKLREVFKNGKNE